MGRRIVGRLPSGRPQYAERSGPTQAGVLAALELAGPPGPSVTVAQWCARWLSEAAVRPNTRAGRESCVRLYVVPTLGAVRVAALTRQQVRRAADQWAGALEPGTVRLALDVLHTAVQAAVEAGVRPDNPVRLVRRPPPPPKRGDPYTPGQLAAIVAAAATRPAWRAAGFLAATGARVGEALALDAGDFDAAAGTVAITKTSGRHGVGPPKSHHGRRTVRVPAPALPCLVPGAAGPLFPSRTGRRWDHAGLYRAWHRLLAHLGLPKRNPHQLRHSVASQLLAAGVGIADVAKYLGDTPATILKTYVHATSFDPAGVLEGLLAAKVGEEWARGPEKGANAPESRRPRGTR